MSVLYHGEQFEKTLGSGPRSAAWELKRQSRRPKRYAGYTRFVANDRGHLLPHIRKSVVHPHHWFASTWELPCKIPGRIISTTGRTSKALEKFSEDRKQWSNDLKRVWMHQNEYEIIMKHFEGVMGPKNSVPLPVEVEERGLTHHWELPGIRRNRGQIYPTNIVPRGVLDEFWKPIICPELKEYPLSNRTTCFHWQGYHHPKYLTCSKFKDDWNRVLVNSYEC